MRTLRRVSSASATNRWHISVEPGVYDVQNETVAMLPFVDIEGSGETNTIITGFAAATLTGASDAELRDITVQHRGGGGVAIVSNDDRFKMHRVTAFSDGTTAISSRGDDADMSYITARTEGGDGIIIRGARGMWKCIDVRVVGGGPIYALFNFGDGHFSQIHAEAEGDSFAGAIRNEAGSPIMRNVYARAKAEGIGQAITNGAGSNAQLYDVVARGTGGERGTGFSNEFGRPVLKNVDVVAEGGLSAFGINNLFGASVTIHDASVVVSGNGNGVALLSGASESIVHSSTLEADGFSVDNRFDPAAVSRIGASQLVGPVAPGAGVMRCVASYDGTFTPLTSTCLP